MSFSPESDIFSSASEQLISVQVTTGGEAINTIQASVNYDPTALKVKDVLLDTTFCEFEIEKTIDNGTGKIIVACAKPNGYIGDRVVLAKLRIQALKPGTSTLTFNDETAVLANDGLGTNVLRAVTNGSYQFIPPPSAGEETTTILHSFTNPNPEHWENEHDVKVSWRLPKGYTEAAYRLTDNPEDSVGQANRTAATAATVAAPSDGIFYFLVQPLKSGSTGKKARLKLLVDTTPPDPPIIQASATDVARGEIVRLILSDAGDNLSGIQKNFYTSFDGGIWLPTLPQLNLSFSDKGTHTVSLRVFDNAGNHNDSTISIKVR